MFPSSGWVSIWYLADSANVRKTPSRFATPRCTVEALALVRRLESSATTPIEMIAMATSTSTSVSPASPRGRESGE
jgi:hypothetical protein